MHDQRIGRLCERVDVDDVRVNGNTSHSHTYPEWNGTSLTNTGVSIWSIAVDVAELVTGSNTVAFSHSSIAGAAPYVSNVQLLTEGGA